MGEERGGRGGEAGEQQIRAPGNPCFSFSSSSFSLCIRRGFDKKFRSRQRRTILVFHFFSALQSTFSFVLILSIHSLFVLSLSIHSFCTFYSIHSRFVFFTHTVNLLSFCAHTLKSLSFCTYTFNSLPFCAHTTAQFLSL